jgi:hypothetical protein
MGVVGSIGRGYRNAQQHVEGSCQFKNAWVFDSFEANRSGFEERSSSRWIELVYAIRFEHGYTPTAIYIIHVAEKVAPMAVSAFAQRATLD